MVKLGYSIAEFMNLAGVCDGFGKTRFVTFDRVDFTFNGNCTHVLAKTVDGSQAPKFKVLLELLEFYLQLTVYCIVKHVFLVTLP